VVRYSSFYVVNNLVPIILSTCLGFFVFLLDGDDMEKRLSERLSGFRAHTHAHTWCLAWDAACAIQTSA
jgi:hypothetical protein